MFKDVIEFIMSRTGIVDRAIAVREANYAWNEMWNSDDLENSLFEITVKPIDNSPRISLPHYVGIIRAVKQNFGKLRIHLNTPRPYYHDETYWQSPYTWRILGKSPLYDSIANATTLTLSIAEAEAADITITLSGKTDNASEDRETLVIKAGSTSIESTLRYMDLTGATKSTITSHDVLILDPNGNEFGVIPNKKFEAKNTVIQVTDKCFKICNTNRCWDILYKIPTPYLYYDEDHVPFEGVLMNKALEWITMPKEGQEDKTTLYAGKATALLQQLNQNEVSIEKKIDTGRGRFTTIYPGYL